MRLVLASAVLAGLAALAAPARADTLRRTVTPMSRADGEVCNPLRAELGDRCTRVARDGNAAVYQSRSRSAGIRRLVLAIDTGSALLVSPAVDVLDDQLESTRPTLRAIAIDGRPGVALDVVSTWRRGNAAEHTESLIGCMQAGAIGKCSQVDIGGCDATLGGDGSITTSCGASSSLAVPGPGA
ncbi:MAG TPA: hypothetical protein VHT91_29950 [Kofleriaceae bacterium]|jgi:hypothetical protein|nr:hypothetical protein [Kofleriaceae bacterium]